MAPRPEVTTLLTTAEARALELLTKHKEALTQLSNACSSRKPLP